MNREPLNVRARAVFFRAAGKASRRDAGRDPALLSGTAASLAASALPVRATIARGAAR
jgi:hypothetical protein